MSQGEEGEDTLDIRGAETLSMDFMGMGKKRKLVPAVF